MSKQTSIDSTEKPVTKKSEKKVKKSLKKVKNDLDKLRKKRDRQHLKLNNLGASGMRDDKAKDLKKRLAKIESKTKKKLRKLNDLKKRQVAMAKQEVSKKSEIKVVPEELVVKVVRKSSVKTSSDLSFKEAIEAIKKMTVEKKIEDFVAVEKRSTVMNAAKNRIKAVRKASTKEKKGAEKKTSRRSKA